MADSLPILTPSPRRPFDINTRSFNHLSSPPSPSQEIDAPSYHRNSYSDRGIETPSYLRVASSANLTASTLSGIYGTEPQTPSELSSRRPSPVSSLHNSLAGFPNSISSFNAASNSRVSSIILKRQQSAQRTPKKNEDTPVRAKAWKFAWRLALLFVIGVCYGLMVFHFQNEGVYVENIMRNARAQEGYNWKYLIFWGAAGVGFGSLLPWIDGLWEETHPSTNDGNRKEQVETKKSTAKSTSGLAADWNPIVRSIGVFVGIAFAIRKLSWTSTLQLSLTLSLVNPVLWYLVDRSLPGLILSFIIGTFGTLILLALNPSILPPPLSLSTSVPNESLTNNQASSSFLLNYNSSSGWDWTMAAREAGVLDYAQLVEIAIWIGSVLFCSAVCFGGIGRRLALRRPS